MTEVTGEFKQPKIKPGDKHRYLKEQYSTSRTKAEEVIQKSGISTKENNRLRKEIAREFFIKNTEAETDELTGILTRKGFMRRMLEELSRIKRTNSKGVLILMDANGLKNLNDTKGHDAGDKLLADIARSLRDTSRVTDVIARLGGDEFAAYLVDTDIQQALEWWERVNEIFESRDISISAGSIEITSSSIPLVSGKKIVEEKMSIADNALYQAKAISKEKGQNYYLISKAN